MKILYLLDKPNLYGSELHVFNLINNFSSEYLISLVAFDNGPLLDLLAENNIPFKIIKLKWYPNSNLIDFYRLLKSDRYDLMHCHQPKALFWGTVFAKILSIKVLITIHSMPETNAQSHRNYIKKVIVLLFHSMIKFLSEWLATGVIYVSKFTFSSSFFKSKGKVIPNWITNKVDIVNLKFDFGNPVSFISIGSVTVNKGMDRMISALSHLKNENWNLKIIGHYDENYKLELLNLAESNGIAEKIIFKGYVSDTDQLLLEADCFILLSRGETFGLAYIEAMNCGLPVIAWDIPAVKEILPTDNLILSKEEDIKCVFQKFFSSRTAFQKISLNNKEFVDLNYSWPNIKNIYRKTYDQILHNSTN